MWLATVWPFLDFAARQRRLLVDLAADVEEGRAHALVGERLEHQRRRALVRAVVEGEDHFVVGERNRSGIGFQPDQQPALRPHFGDARSAELVGPAFGRRGGVRRPRRAREADEHATRRGRRSDDRRRCPHRRRRLARAGRRRRIKRSPAPPSPASQAHGEGSPPPVKDDENLIAGPIPPIVSAASAARLERCRGIGRPAADRKPPFNELLPCPPYFALNVWRRLVQAVRQPPRVSPA